MIKNITYGVDPLNGAIYARYDNRIAFYELEYDKMQFDNKFAITYKLAECHVFDICTSAEWKRLKWTKKIPIEIKNQFRAFFGFKLLKGESK